MGKCPDGKAIPYRLPMTNTRNIFSKLRGCGSRLEKGGTTIRVTSTKIDGNLPGVFAIRIANQQWLSITRTRSPIFLRWKRLLVRNEESDDDHGDNDDDYDDDDDNDDDYDDN